MLLWRELIATECSCPAVCASTESASATALKDAVVRLGGHAVRVVLDCDEEVFRLGYGDVECVRELQEAGVDVRQCAGLRVGLLVVDDRAWTFTPTALYVQPEVQNKETPNAMELPPAAAQPLVDAVWAEAPRSASTLEHTAAETEIGQVPLGSDELARAEDALEVAPPLPFDVARQVRVFQPYIQYVEIKLNGCAIQRHRITIPKKIAGMDGASGLEDRLRTTSS